MQGLDSRTVAQLLAQHCERLFTELVTDARPEGAELRGHGPDGAVWSIVTRGHKRGIWANWAAPTEQRGDCLELVHHALFPDEVGRSASFLWSLRWLGLANSGDVNREELAQIRERAARAHRQRALDAAQRAREASRQALGLYLAGEPDRPEIASYLQEGRGFGEYVPADAWPLHILRFHDSVFYQDGWLRPAMLAPIAGPSGGFLAVHCTFLECRNGAWRNVEDSPRRKIYGPKRGGVIKLDRGATGKRHPCEDDWLLLGEGVENSLAAALCCPETPGLPDAPRIWAAVDVGNFSAIELPPAAARIILAHDQDDERFGTLRASLAAAWISEGRKVWHLSPPRGFKDFNDYVRRLVAADA